MPDMLRRNPLLQCTLALFACVALVLSMSACDTLDSVGKGEDDPDVEPGNFEMVLSGAVTDTIEGVAVFGTTTVEDTSDAEQDVFGLVFSLENTDTDAAQQMWFISQIMRASARPETGEYVFAEIGDYVDQQNLPTDKFAFSLSTGDSTRTVLVTSDRGTLTLTTSSSARVAGTFSVDASGMVHVPDEGEPQNGTVNIEGSFNALGGQLPDQQ